MDSVLSSIKPADSTFPDFASPCVTETGSSTDSVLIDAVQMQSMDSNAIQLESSTASHVIPSNLSDAAAPVLVLANSSTTSVSLKDMIDSMSEADGLTPHSPHTPLGQWHDEDDDV